MKQSFGHVIRQESFQRSFRGDREHWMGVGKWGGKK